MSYLRGEQKDGTANRGGQDFGSTLVLEIKDTGNGITTCFGVLFEIWQSRYGYQWKNIPFSVTPDPCRRMSIWKKEGFLIPEGG